MLWEAHWLHDNAQLIQKIYNTDTVAYATYSGSYSTEAKRKYTGYTLVHTWYTTIIAVHNIHSSALYIYLLIYLLSIYHTGRNSAKGKPVQGTVLVHTHKNTIQP